ncbi:putative fatty-acid--CoA ligase [Gordonia araii NBRC 100433]|uniref:Putative fatty-acid--CoA ligase n=2 Tax=Gordonia araii TaxID=263909 RepID=G7GY64_9ACTN|nr:putative fatty-acid--CoA ligase [Gordonia araii NBRC 100433]
MQRSGLIDLRRPDLIWYAARGTRRLGPIAGAVRLSARRCPDRVAVIDGETRVTYRELHAKTDAIASAWVAEGVTDRSTVAVLCRDHLGLVEAMIAAAKLGSRLVLMNTGFAGAQLADVARREGIDAVVADDEFAESVSLLPDSVRRLDPSANRADKPAPSLPRQQGGFVILTGGTTGTPKGVPRRVRSPLAAAQFLDRVPLRPGGVTLLCAPLFHGTALSQFILSLNLGCTNVLHGRFDAARALTQVDEHRVTAMVVVPTMLRRILDLGADVLAAHRTDSLRVVFSAGAALPPALGTRAVEAFGPTLYNFYGCTETGTATIATPDDWLAAPGTVGRPPVGITVRLYGDDGHPVTAPNSKGTVHVGNPIAFQGYSGGGNKDVVDGLMSTGDVGHWDAAGRLFIDGRADDMIVSGGENVFPGEVENLLNEHPAIAEVAVVGVPDDEFGERLAAFVVSRDELTADEVRRHVRDRLARFKVPRDVHFVDELPRTATGKIATAVLSDMAGRR